MNNLREFEDDMIDVIVTGQAFSDAIDTISDKFFYKRMLKKRGNDFMIEIEKIVNNLLNNTYDDKHREEILQIFDIHTLLNNKLSKLDLLQKKLLLENFDRVEKIVDELVMENSKN